VAGVQVDWRGVRARRAGGGGGVVLQLDSFLALGGDKTHELVFPLFPEHHPLYILYSSGTTGAPKCIVHGTGGTLIQHKKEHVLHCGLGPGKRMLYYTTVSWMMWHWLVSALASGTTLVLYDGSPFRYKSSTDPTGSAPDDLAMPRLIQELSITHFGTSAKYLSVLEQKQATPNRTLDLSSLEAIYSTGSPLAPSTFSYVYSSFSPSVNLASITGGTDIVSLFGAPIPLAPVFAGEIQHAGLGMAVRAYDHTGADVTSSGHPGDLVCVRAFPCQPVTFFGPDGADKYRRSYFSVFFSSSSSSSPAGDGDHHQQPIWHHGDFVRFNPATGGLVMLGRSDGILNPSGVRFGSAEMYNVLLRWFPSQVTDALCIGRRREMDVDETVVLFVKMADGLVLTDELVKDIRATVRKELSPRHVPAVVDACLEIPMTSNGKK
jgi:acetoacetyl-CoA synthetase